MTRGSADRAKAWPGSSPGCGVMDRVIGRNSSPVTAYQRQKAPNARPWPASSVTVSLTVLPTLRLWVARAPHPSQRRGSSLLLQASQANAPQRAHAIVAGTSGCLAQTAAAVLIRL